MDVLSTVRQAVAIVCDLDAASVSAGTRLDSVGGDSLARVAIADLIETWLRASRAGWRIDDGALGQVETVGELAAVVRKLVGADATVPEPT